jgi:hypothetical protein
MGRESCIEGEMLAWFVDVSAWHVPCRFYLLGIPHHFPPQRVKTDVFGLLASPRGGFRRFCFHAFTALVLAVQVSHQEQAVSG